MYLSKLEIVGFKSFAHKTALKFNDGITAVVGPNGCGKSNVIDAIRWAIGEQRASALRSDKMEEVIFNGAGKRRPLGMAEVSLTIENTKGILPTEYSEVTITRRLFRNGDSEYLLNKVQCRLRDIVDLFMDTGMGANAYSVIELKMIETILSDRADERRKLFDEAAGVTKYKVRRKEALRKLDATQQDLLRVNDIVKEVSKKVTSLERQAKKAEEYTALDKERKELEMQIMAREYAATMAKIAPLEEKLVSARALKEELDAQLAHEEIVIRELEEEQARIEAAHLQAQGEVNAVTERISALERERAVAEERRRSLLMVIERAERDRAEAQGGIEALVLDAQEEGTLLEGIRGQIAAAEAEYEETRAQVTQAEGELNDRRRAAKGSQSQVITLLNSIAELRGNEERTLARLDSIQRRMTELEEQDEEARIDARRAQEMLNEIESELTRAQARIEEAQQQFENAQELKSVLRAETDDLRTRTIELHNAINTRQSKMEFLTGLVDQDESVRFLVGQEDWNTGEKITVAEAIGTDERYRIAIATALGGAAHYLVVPGFENAVRGMRSLESNRKGKATFVCLDRIPESPGRSPLDGPGAIGWASHLCSSAPEHEMLLRHLLGDTAVVGTIEDATAVMAAGIADQAVTLGGVLVREGGIVRGGGQRKDEGITIGKREQIERLEREIEELTGRLDALNDDIERKTREHNEINLGQLSDGVRRAQQELGEVERRRAQAGYEKEYAEDLLEEHDVERGTLNEELLQLQEKLAGSEPDRVALREQQEQAERNARELGVELDLMEAGFAGLVRSANERHVRLVNLRSDERSALAELERIRRDRENAERMIEQRRVERERAESELASLEETLSDDTGQIEELRAEQAAASAKLEEVIRDQAAKRDEITKHANLLREERRGHDTSVTQIHELDMKISELRNRAESIALRSREELEVEVDAVEITTEEIPIDELRGRHRQVKDRIKSLGTVNLLAFEEWTQESERHGFLLTQLEDLKNAEKSLLDTIIEINETAQGKFVETFDKIRQNFVNIFTTLFMEGDEADLKLGEGDPLEAGIEIIAKPRGKRPHSIDLLSGGEKTLTAIALLFSIYLVKPSPFCILDEVDAPLDDANIDRFVQLIRRFVGDTQFIIVTHNKRTMNAADTMYGVTQEEDGVSKIVSVRFTEGPTGGAKQAARVAPQEVPAEAA